MTNKQLKERTEQVIKSLGTFDDWMRGKKLVNSEWVEIKNPFPYGMGRKYAYNLARGKFAQCGKHGLLIMKDYFLNLENDKQNEH